MTPLFLWPRPRPLRTAHFLGRPVATGTLENRLREMFPGAEPVLFSSARAALSAILEHLGLGRPDLVWCPPYSSHCVFDAVARVATPATEITSPPRAALIYHQWGHLSQPAFAADTLVIEDAVDTLFVPGSPPFAIGGRFALWSLPKTIASHWGGVAFCQTAADAEALRSRRDQRPLPATLQALLRLAGNTVPAAGTYWHGAEAAGGRLPAFALRHIADCLDHLGDEIEARRRRLQQLQPYSLAPPPPASRLPCCLPLPASAAPAGPLASGQELTAGLRNFNIAGTFPRSRWEKVFPAPIHQDVSGTDIAEFVAKIDSAPQIQPR